MQRAIPYMQLRGGSSKGLYFCASDLPAAPALRNKVLIAAMGADKSQIDGLGGADPLTSKVAIVGLSDSPDADIDYLFAQVVVGGDRVDTTPNCGNILAGVAPFAIEAGLIEPTGDSTTVRINMLNSGSQCELVVRTPNGKVEYQGDACIDGVPGSAAPIAKLGWHIIIYFEAPDLPEYYDFFASLNTIVVVDHMGRPDCSKPIDGEEFELFLKLLRENDNCWTKVTCPERLSLQGPPSYDDFVPFAARVVELFPDRVLWGTDWPHPNMKSHMPDDGHLVDMIPRIAPTAELQRKLLVDNPMRLCWPEEN